MSKKALVAAFVAVVFGLIVVLFILPPLFNGGTIENIVALAILATGTLSALLWLNSPYPNPKKKEGEQ